MRIFVERSEKTRAKNSPATAFGRRCYYHPAITDRSVNMVPGTGIEPVRSFRNSGF